MATYENIIKGLELFAKTEGEDKHHIAAEHDELWAGHDCKPENMTSGEQAILKHHGWSYDEEVGAWHRFV